MISFFYFSFNDIRKQSTREMLSSLIKQICYNRPDTLERVKQLRKYMDNSQTPGLDVLETTLISTLYGFTSIYLVLDALDEYLEIRLAYFSIKEYLISSRISQSLASIFSIHEITMHAHITDSCLTYHLDRSKTILATKKEMKLF